MREWRRGAKEREEAQKTSVAEQEQGKPTPEVMLKRAKVAEKAFGHNSPGNETEECFEVDRQLTWKDSESQRSQVETRVRRGRRAPPSSTASPSVDGHQDRGREG